MLYNQFYIYLLEQSDRSNQAVYYLNRACDYAPGLTTCPTNFNSTAPPAGLRMVVGSPTLR
jgi:hypothetical protein